MGAVWLSETSLCLMIGTEDSRALLEALGGLTVYIPKAPGPTKTFGLNLEDVLSPEGFAALCRHVGGETVSLPNVRRKTGSKQIRRLLDQGKSHRQIAEDLRVSVRYVEMVASRPAPPAQLSLFQRPCPPE